MATSIVFFWRAGIRCWIKRLCLSSCPNVWNGACRFCSAGSSIAVLLADPRPGITFNYVEAPREIIDRALRIGQVCQSHGVPLKAAALQFPLAHPAIATVITGVRSAAEFQENERLFQVSIPNDLWKELKAEGLLDETAPVPINEEKA